MTTLPDPDELARYDVPTGALAAWAHARRGVEVGLVDAYREALSHNSALQVEGMPLDEYARLVCRLSRAEVAQLRRVAERARRLPAVMHAFDLQQLTLAQVDQIGGASVHLSDAEVALVDADVAEVALAGSTVAPDEVLIACKRAVRSLLSAREAVAAEDHDLEQGRLRLLPSPRGGGSFEGFLDDEGFQTLVAAVEGAAGPPRPDRTRAQQLAEGLVALAAGPAGGRARPRVVVHVDLGELTDAQGGTLRTGVPGAAPTITARTLEAIACDAELVAQLTEGARPLVRLNVDGGLPGRTREAVLDRDGGCRWPGCDAPVGWVDAHHLVPQAAGGDHDPDNLVSLCRRHHRMAHRTDWDVALDGDTGAFTVRRRGLLLESMPRGRPPRPVGAVPQPDIFTFTELEPPLPAWA